MSRSRFIRPPENDVHDLSTSYCPSDTLLILLLHCPRDGERGCSRHIPKRNLSLASPHSESRRLQPGTVWCILYPLKEPPKILPVAMSVAAPVRRLASRCMYMPRRAYGRPCKLIMLRNRHIPGSSARADAPTPTASDSCGRLLQTRQGDQGRDTGLR